MLLAAGRSEQFRLAVINRNDKCMNESITFTSKDGYLLVSITDKVITVERAREILAQISEECSVLNSDRVLLDEMSVESREVPPDEIEKLAFDFNKNKPEKVYIAFLCQPHLVGYDTNLLSLYTYRSEFVIRHFTNEEEAIDWLDNKSDS